MFQARTPRLSPIAKAPPDMMLCRIAKPFSRLALYSQFFATVAIDGLLRSRPLPCSEALPTFLIDRNCEL